MAEVSTAKRQDAQTFVCRDCIRRRHSRRYVRDKSIARFPRPPPNRLQDGFLLNILKLRRASEPPSLPLASLYHHFPHPGRIKIHSVRYVGLSPAHPRVGIAEFVATRTRSVDSLYYERRSAGFSINCIALERATRSSGIRDDAAASPREDLGEGRFRLVKPTA